MTRCATADHSSQAIPHTQRGVALVVALILLVLATLIGLASIQGTTLQARMSSNMYDRSLALHRSEAALRAAEAAITSNWRIAELGGVDCSPESAALCPVVPPSTFADDDTNWVAVDSAHDVNDGRTPGRPQYHVQFVGTGSSESDLGLEANADYGNYGNPYPPDDVAYYRVTARSANRQVTDDRALVVLQSTVKRAY